ncbi:MAG: hypothetical protein B0A82_07565 [Alkalinema sp. CACIAM 70d]|nr:MAG: hypothetical protein B0A82_07565 [Alkalinema sp. CACIAM 70d]
MTQQPDRSVFEQLIARLRHAQIDWDAENIADALWLARYVEGQSDRANRSTQAAAKPKIRTETVTGEASPPLPPPELGLYAQGQPAQSPNQPNQSNPAAPGLPFKTPTAPALRQTLEIGRSLRPLRRRVDSYRRRVLDEEATAEQTAEQQFCMTVVQPEPENWLEVALVMEYTPSSFIWQDTLQSFKQLLEHQGAFRSVNVWHLKVVQDTASQNTKEQNKAANGTTNAVQLFTHLPGSRPQKPRSLKELIDPAGRRLILVLSDCVSAAWQQGVIQEACLELWAQRGPIAIMQFLPGRLWGRTALRSGVAVKLSSLTPGAANRELLLHEVPVWSDSQTDRGLKLPIVTLEPGSLGLWAKMVAGFGEQRVAGVWFDEGWKDWVQAEATPAGDWTAEQLVDRFNTTASLLARKLAILMAIVPVQLPIIYLIQATMLRESTPLHLAEVFMSGLIRQEAGAAAAEQATEPAYEFVAGVRERLLDLADPGEAEQLLDRVSQYVGQKIGRSLYSFTALLRLEQELQGTDVADLLKFATVTKQAVKRLGGAYAELVRAMEARPPVPPPGPLVQFPPLQRLEFTWVQLEEEDAELEEEEPETPLPERVPFEFTIATLRQEGRERVIQNQAQQAYRFVEELAPEVVLEMVAIPGGRFLMGSPEDEPERYDDESPQHEVTVPSFFMGRYPVTQAQWRWVAGLPPINQELDPVPSRFKGDNHPVEQVSWHDAVEFCARLSAHTGRPYRLPSEAEWEYACRAGTTTPFHFGQTISTDLANYNSNSTYKDGPKGEYRGKTTPVDQFGIANAFGLCDMHGNVWEWCADHWHDNYEGAPVDGSAWVDQDAGEDNSYVLRGGSWCSFPGSCRSATRYNYLAGARNDSYGFRVVCSAPGLFPSP